VEEPPSEASIAQFWANFRPKSSGLSGLVDCPLPILAFMSTRQLAAGAGLLLYSAWACRQPLEATIVLFCSAAVVAAVFMLLPRWTSGLRIAAILAAYLVFATSRIETRRFVMATAVLVWVLASTYFVGRLERLEQPVAAKIVGAISDLWLIAMLTLLSLQGYIVTGLLLLSAASWIPRAGKSRFWFALAYVVLGGWLIIAAKLDINLELRRWYLLGALAVGIGASLVASAQEVQQREDVHPE
jgi:hypothetical protein